MVNLLNVNLPLVCYDLNWSKSLDKCSENQLFILGTICIVSIQYTQWKYMIYYTNFKGNWLRIEYSVPWLSYWPLVDCTELKIKPVAYLWPWHSTYASRIWSKIKLGAAPEELSIQDSVTHRTASQLLKKWLYLTIEYLVVCNCMLNYWGTRTNMKMNLPLATWWLVQT